MRVVLLYDMSTILPDVNFVQGNAKFLEVSLFLPATAL